MYSSTCSVVFDVKLLADEQKVVRTEIYLSGCVGVETKVWISLGRRKA